MEIKKSPKADLERGKGLSLLMGFVVGLAVLFVSFEWTSTEVTVATEKDQVQDIIAEEEIEITRPENTPPPPPPPAAPVVAEELNIVEDDVELEQQEIVSSEDDATAAQQETFVAAPVVEEEEEEEAQQIFTVVEKQPEFPGGTAELMKFLSKNIKYPVEAQKAGQQGRVICQFVVTKEGKPADIKVVRGVSPVLDNEAVRVIKAMPAWTPGKQDGQAVNVRYTLPVTFRLQ